MALDPSEVFSDAHPAALEGKRISSTGLSPSEVFTSKEPDKGLMESAADVGIGTGKALVGGAAGLVHQAAAGMASGAYALTHGGGDFKGRFTAKKEQLDEVYHEKFGHVFDPQGKMQEAPGKILGLPFEAAERAGDNLFDLLDQSQNRVLRSVAPFFGAVGKTAGNVAAMMAMAKAPGYIGDAVRDRKPAAPGPVPQPGMFDGVKPELQPDPQLPGPQGKLPAPGAPPPSPPQIPHDGTIFVDANGKHVKDPWAARPPTKDVTPVPLPPHPAREMSNGKYHSVWEKASALVSDNVGPGESLRMPGKLVTGYLEKTSPPETKEFFSRLKDLAGDVQVVFKPHIPDKDGHSVAGQYHPGRHLIEIASKHAHDPGYVTGVLVHELAHAASSRYLHDNPTAPESRRLDALYLEAKLAAQRLDKARGTEYSKQYGLTNAHEFVSEALSNTTFQKFLALAENFGSKAVKGARNRNFKNPETSQNFKFIQDLFGIKNPKYPSTLLRDTLNQVDAIFSEQDKVGGNKAKELNWKDQQPRQDLVKGPDSMQKGPGKQSLGELPKKGKTIQVLEEDLFDDWHPGLAESLGVAEHEIETDLLEDPKHAKPLQEQGWTIYKVDADGTVRQLENLSEKNLASEEPPYFMVRRVEEHEHKLDRMRNERQGQKVLAEAARLESIQASAGIRDATREIHEKVSAAERAQTRWGTNPDDPIIYMHAGIPITKSHIEAAFRMGRSALEKVPGFLDAEAKLTDWWMQALRTFNPEGLGPEARASAAITARHISEQIRSDSQHWHRAADRMTFWNMRAQEAMDFIHGFERGKKFADPLLNQAAEGYRQWAKEIFEQDKRSGLKYEAVDHYMPHLFEDSEGVSRWAEQKWGSKWGDPGFIKDRGFDLYEEAIKAGFKPKYTNPEAIMLARQHASDIAQMRVNILRDLEGAGLAKRATESDPRPPKDWPTSRWRSPSGDTYWVDKKAAQILHNAFESKSLWSMQNIGGDAFRVFMEAKNRLVPIKLALSLFHPLHVQTIDNATGMVRASKELFSGTINPAQWMAQMGKSALYLDSVKNFTGGHRLLKVFQGKIADKDITPADALALEYMAEGGFIPEMSAQYRSSAMDNLRQAIAQARGHFEQGMTVEGLKAGGKGALELPWAAIQATQGIMFEHWIPSLKIASYLKDVDTALRTDPSLHQDALKRQQAFRRIAKSVDNRYGEMAYSTLFWDRMAKDAAVGSSLSLGWNLGFLREYGGGGLDVGQFLGRTGKIKAIREGNLDRPMFVVFYTTQALLYGGLITYALSGSPPEHPIDYVLPKTGEKNADGTDARVNTMFYSREFYSIAKHMQNEGTVSGLGHAIANKAAPTIGLINEWATNQNSFGEEISDPNAPAFKRLQQKLVYTLQDLTPISVEQAGSSGKSKALAFAGFTPAPKYATESPTEAAIRTQFQKYYGAKSVPYEKAEYSRESRELRKAWNEGDGSRARELLEDIRTKFKLTPSEMKRLEKSAQSTPQEAMVKMFSRLDWRLQKQILDKATEEERQQLLPHANREHLRHAYTPGEEE